MQDFFLKQCAYNIIPQKRKTNQTKGHINVKWTDKDRTKNKMVFLNWMNITMQHSKGIGVQVWPHLARDPLLWQHLWLYLKQLHCYGLASAPVRGYLKLYII